MLFMKISLFHYFIIGGGPNDFTKMLIARFGRFCIFDFMTFYYIKKYVILIINCHKILFTRKIDKKELINFVVVI